MISIEQIRVLLQQLLPNGRAFKAPVNGWVKAFNYAISIKLNRLYLDCTALLFAIIPDNTKFTKVAAEYWERVFGLPDGTGKNLSDRKLAILQKMAFSSNVLGRQHYLYIQGQLRDAGFDVYVYENRFPYGGGTYFTRTAIDLFGGTGSQDVQHGDFQHGDVQHGGVWADKVANSVDPARDLTFNVGNTLTCTFFICGDPIGTPAYVPAARRTEFRKLILSLKPAHTVAYLFIVYT